MSRNLFEENDNPEAQEFMEIGAKEVQTILPALPEGYRYELVKLSNGRTAVVVEKNASESGRVNLSDIRKAESDKFGRPYHG